MRAGPSHLGVIAATARASSPPTGDEVSAATVRHVRVSACFMSPDSVYGGRPRFVEAPPGLTAFRLPGQYKWECTDGEKTNRHAPGSHRGSTASILFVRPPSHV